MEMIFYFLLLCCGGLIIGSFLNSVIYRLSIENTSFYHTFIQEKRSYCPHCKHRLSIYDLVPVVSFLMLGGRCRYCCKSISWQYPLVEIMTALIFTGIGFLTPTFLYPILETLFAMVVMSSLIIIFVYDFYYYLIPDRIVFPMLFITVIYQLLFHTAFFFRNGIWAGLLSAGCFAILHFGSRGTWMGFGDVKLVLLLGFFLGFPKILVALFLAFFIGAIVGSFMMLMKGMGLKSQIPFAPFLIIGTIIAFFWGTDLISWYILLL